MTYCSRFLSGEKPRFNREGGTSREIEISIFNHDAELKGAKIGKDISSLDYEQLNWYVLNHTKEVDEYVE